MAAINAELVGHLDLRQSVLPCDDSVRRMVEGVGPLPYFGKNVK